MSEIAGDTLLDRVRSLPPGTRLTTDWTSGQLCDRAEEQAAALRRNGTKPGEAVCLPLPNGDGWILALLALLTAGARPLLVAPETTESERTRLLGLAGDGEAGVLIPTSGSTGEPKLVARSESSLIAEGVRYHELLGLDPQCHVLLPIPLSHAYALGWLAGTLITGAQVRALQPTALNAIAADLAERATHLALVPTTARLLAARQLRRGGAAAQAPAPHVRIAMIGAGPVDDNLEDSFRRAFGVATARNYGSTETGAVFAGIPPLPPFCVGRPMPGVEYRIVDDADAACPVGVSGSLQIRFSGDQAWHDMADIAREGEDGVVILGRKSSGIRRGGQWVAPLEVEAVLREHDAVRDSRVWSKPGRFRDEDVLVADVEVADPGSVRSADLMAFARQRLAIHKVPQEIGVFRRLPRTAAGKITAPRRYRLADSQALLRASRAYRISELLFSLLEMGALPLLAEGANTDELARELGVPATELDWLLAVACWLGLVDVDPGPLARADQAAPAALPFIELEAELSASWVTRKAIIESVRSGLRHRPFDKAILGDQLQMLYRRAMHDEAAVQRAKLALRLARPPWPERVVEVSAGPGRYLKQLLTGEQLSYGFLVQIGRLAGPVSPALRAGTERGQLTVGDDPPAGDFDLCVIDNGIHGPHPGDDLGWLLSLIKPGGAVLIDDVFLPLAGGQGSELGLDWLTHGGIAWPHAEELIDGLVAAGQDISMHKKLGSTGCHLILARQG